ncbi:MAG: diaminopimelate epimerase [Rickettsiales bacterium]|nr:diaminopimelate epimerase [Rickettsiales bacterium]
MTKRSFKKMHGAGNDFVVMDLREAPLSFTPAMVKQLATRHTGIGCDQLVLIEPSEQADIFMRLYNSDGSEVGACGNATRCVAWEVMEETQADEVSIETQAGILHAKRAGDCLVSVNMGKPKLEWEDIPLSEARNTEHLGIAEGMLMDPVAVNVGNPHMVFFVSDLSFIDMEESGPILEKNSLFPKHANVTAAHIHSRNEVEMQVWERGAGITLACGTAACATLVAGVRRGLLDRKATMQLPGGELEIFWDEKSGELHKTGPVDYVYHGEYELEA